MISFEIIFCLLLTLQNAPQQPATVPGMTAMRGQNPHTRHDVRHGDTYPLAKFVEFEFVHFFLFDIAITSGDDRTEGM